MRVYEVVLRSGARVEILAEHMQESSPDDARVIFYSDKNQKKMIAYFQREDVAGIVFGPDSGSTVQRNK